MDIATIARRLRLPLRRVRYVIDQAVLPGLRGRRQAEQVGQRRTYLDVEAFYIACAAVLLHSGLQRRTVADALAHLAEMTWPPPGMSPEQITLNEKVTLGPTDTALEWLWLHAAEPAELWIGDGVHLRVVMQERDTGWLEPRSQVPLAESYRPRAAVRLDLAGVKEALFARPAR